MGETEMQATIPIQATSLRQSAEWGMSAIQGSFPCLKDWLIFFRRHGEAKHCFTFDCHVIKFPDPSSRVEPVKLNILPNV